MIEREKDYCRNKSPSRPIEYGLDGKRLLGMPMSEIWPGAKAAAELSIGVAERSRQDERLYGQCDPAY